MSNIDAPRTILITGASSGIGAALAREYAGPGVRLVIGARRRARLEAVAEACRQAGAAVEDGVIDVTDQQAMADWIAASDDANAIDLAIANAGISAGTGSAGEPDEQAREIFAINVGGVLNTVQPVLARMRARGAGQIAIMSSLASFFGFAGTPAYCASKAAVRVWGESLRNTQSGDGAHTGVLVSVLCPGFVRTPMTDVNAFPMPGIVSAEHAARIIRRGLAADRGRIAFPYASYIGVRLLGLLPDRLLAAALARYPGKPSMPE